MQDTPAIKTTYNATVYAESKYVVRMSANVTNITKFNDTHTVTTFSNNVPIPSYLLALAVGDL
jgi:aminopeptidase N